MGCAYAKGKSIGKKITFFNIEMAELAAEARGMTIEKLYQEIPALLETKWHLGTVDFMTETEASLLLNFPIAFFYHEVKVGEDKIFVCGEGIVACAFCGCAADFRCDAPIGEGRTCDLPLCIEHKHHRPDIPSDIDYCPHHQK